MSNDNSSVENSTSSLEAIGWQRHEIERVKEVVSEYKNQEGVNKIWLYGSMAKGNFDQNDHRSDIDLAVEVENLKDDDWRTEMKDEGIPGKREIQIQIFRAGYEEEVMARPVKSELDMTIRSAAEERLKNQIVLWEKTKDTR